MRWFGYVLVLFFSTPVFAFTPCLTSTNADHVVQGRGVQTIGVKGDGFYATGSSDYLGKHGSSYISLYESSGMVDGLIQYYKPYGYEPIDFVLVSSNTYGVVFYNASTHCCFVSQFESSTWAVSECDMDEDGMADDFEYERWGNTDASGTDDSDGDGIINRLEYLTGSDPTDSTDRSDIGNFFHYDSLGRLRHLVRTTK